MVINATSCVTLAGCLVGLSSLFSHLWKSGIEQLMLEGDLVPLSSVHLLGGNPLIWSPVLLSDL
jgi:hypothetical protein